MADSFTPDKTASLKMATGENENTWGIRLNNETIDPLSSTVTKQLSKNVAGATDVILTASECKNASLKLTGAITANFNVIVVNGQGFYYFDNSTSGAFSITVKTSAGTGVVIPQGFRTLVYCDGVNVVDPINALIALRLSGNLTGVSGASAITGFTIDGDVNTIINVLPEIITLDYQALLSHDVASGTHGGASVGAAWTTRLLNTEIHDPQGLTALAANQFTLAAGTYEITGSQMFLSAADVQVSFKGRIRNITDGVTVAISESARLHIPVGASANASCIIPPTLFTLTATKTFELQYYAQTGIATFGLGFAANSGENERYAWVHIRRIA